MYPYQFYLPQSHSNMIGNSHLTPQEQLQELAKRLTPSELQSYVQSTKQAELSQPKTPTHPDSPIYTKFVPKEASEHVTQAPGVIDQLNPPSKLVQGLRRHNANYNFDVEAQFLLQNYRTMTIDEFHKYFGNLLKYGNEFIYFFT
eukprot:UN31342